MSIVPYTPGQIRLRMAQRYPDRYPIKPNYYSGYPLNYPYFFYPPYYPVYRYPLLWQPTYPWPTAYYSY